MVNGRAAAFSIQHSAFTTQHSPLNRGAMPAARIDARAAGAIAARIFPGAAVHAQRAGRAVHHAAYGATMYGDPGSLPAATDTIYDIASLTKLCTATAALILCDAGQI
ncbi:MAG: serine hydrolase, partial [Chloroflexales bacterium]